MIHCTTEKYNRPHPTSTSTPMETIHVKLRAANVWFSWSSPRNRYTVWLVRVTFIELLKASLNKYLWLANMSKILRFVWNALYEKCRVLSNLSKKTKSFSKTTTFTTNGTGITDLGRSVSTHTIGSKRNMKQFRSLVGFIRINSGCQLAANGPSESFKHWRIHQLQYHNAMPEMYQNKLRLQVVLLQYDLVGKCWHISFLVLFENPLWNFPLKAGTLFTRLRARIPQRDSAFKWERIWRFRGGVVKVLVFFVWFEFWRKWEIYRHALRANVVLRKFRAISWFDG